MNTLEIASDRLRLALEGAQPEIEAGLAGAESELAQLEERREQLLALIARAKAVLGSGPGTPAGMDAGPRAAGRPPTLHEAMAQVLRSHGNEPMTARDLASEINEECLYRKRDETAVETNQIHARAKNYGALFEKVGTRIRLKEWDPPTS